MKTAIYLCFILLISIIVLSHAQSSTTKKPVRTCACEDSEEPICASNGITYKNTCRFDCAKARVNRLRMVKKGKCGTTISVGQYWQNRNSKFD